MELTEEQVNFITECEEKFNDRYTDKDEEFMKIKSAEPRKPPIVDPWHNMHQRSNNWSRQNQRRDQRRNQNWQRHDNARDRDRDRERDRERDRDSYNRYTDRHYAQGYRLH